MRLKKKFRNLTSNDLDHQNVSYSDDYEANRTDGNQKVLSLVNTVDEIRPATVIPPVFDE